MSWYNPFSWGEKNVNDFRTDIDPDSAQLAHRDNIAGTIRQQLAGVQTRTAPQADRTTIGQVSQYGGGGQFRDRLGGLATRLEGIASGQTAGAGELAVQRQGERAIANQQGMARMSRGTGNAALAARGAARNAGNIGVDVAGQAQQAAMQDQQGALGQLGQVLGQGSAQDVQVGLANMDANNQRVFQQAGLDQATSLSNMQSKLQTMGMNDQAAQAYLAQLFGIDQAEMAARLAQDQLRVQQELGLANVDTTGWGGQLMNIVGQAAAGYATSKSDRRAKTKIRAAKDVDSMLERLKAFEYEYKDPDKPLRGRGRHVSVMAQDLERSKLGKAMVEKGEDGQKVVNYGKGYGTLLATTVRLHERLKELEAK